VALAAGSKSLPRILAMHIAAVPWGGLAGPGGPRLHCRDGPNDSSRSGERGRHGRGDRSPCISGGPSTQTARQATRLVHRPDRPGEREFLPPRALVHVAPLGSSAPRTGNKLYWAAFLQWAMVRDSGASLGASQGPNGLRGAFLLLGHASSGGRCPILPRSNACNMKQTSRR
jgi:hypothetical protein